MKNFTNNFKQFTSRLSARWLIIALMLLLGTSSAWADWYIAGSFNGWSTNNSNYKLSKNNSQEYFITGVQLSNGDEFKFVENNQNWKGWNEISTKNGGDLENANGNIKITKSGTYDFYYTPSTGYLYTSYIVCASCCTNYYLKHPWGTGNDNDWTWKELKKEDCSNNIYTLTALYGGKGCDYSKPGVQDKQGYTEATLEGNPKTGDECIFTFNATNNTITITKVVTCNEITDVSSFSLSEKTYDFNGEPKKPTVSSTLNGIGDIIPKYYNSQGNEVNEPTNAGTYTVKITVSQGTTYCALTTETVVDTYTINKINQSDISIANEETTFCGFPANNKVTLNIEGGDGDGEVVYKSEDEDIATISGNILTVKAEGTVTISAQKQAGTNHKVSNTATKQFTFYKAPDAPTVKSVTNLIKCGDAPASDGIITLDNYNQSYTYAISPDDGVGGNAQEGYKISKADDYTITVTRRVNETCSLSTSSATIPVGLTDKTPAATVSIADVTPICEGGSATLTCNVTPTKGTVNSYTWTLPNGSTQVTNTNTLSTGVIADADTYNYSVVVTLENDGCTKDFTSEIKSVTVKEVPTAPDFGDNNSETVCQGTTVNLPTGFNWYDAETGGNKVADTAIEATGTYWAAAVQNECESATRTRYDVTVNPKPSIGSITQNVALPVPFEDVVLTATDVTQGAEVRWYLGNDETPVATGTTYVVTSENEGEVTVKAKAFLGDCESDFKEHKVTFDKENCQGSLISAPAVKTVSATSVEGVVNFVGRVIKTGCAAGTKIYVGYQYKKKDDVWPTTGVTAGTGEKQLIPIGKNLVDFSKTIEGLGDGDYHFRAYIINGYDFTNGNYDQGVYYGIDIPVTVSTKKYPIKNLQVKYANDRGEVLQDQNVTYCVGDNAYIKLIYDGSRLKPEDDVINISSTLENTFTLVEGEADLYTFVVKGNETITVNAKNKENTDNPTAELTINTHAEPAAPYISINPASGIICEGSEATIKVENPSKACSYKLVEEEDTKAGFKKYESGNLTYTVGSVGKYYVAAKHIACRTNEYTSNQVAINQIIRTSANISIEPEEAETTPWEKVSIKVIHDEGYGYDLTYPNGLDNVENVIIEQVGDTYTYSIPRPWTTGDANPKRASISYQIKAKLKVDGEATQCNNMSEASTTITLKDEENEDCDLHIEP